MRAWLRFPPPLHIFVPLVALVCSFVYLTFKLLLVTEWSAKRIMNTQLGSAQIHAQKLASIMSSIEKTGSKPVAEEIAYLQTYPSVRWAAVCDAGGRVLYCTRPEWVGRPLSEVAPSVALELVGQAVKEHRPVQRLIGRESAIAANPGPVGPDAPLRYLALAERDVARVIAERYKHGRSDVLTAACVVTVCCVLLGGVLYLFLKWRLRDIYRNTGLMGKTSHRHVHGGDEFAQIAGVLGEAEHVLRDVGHNIQEVVWILTPDLKPMYLSPAFEKMHLRKRDEAYGNNAIPDYILEEHRDAVRDAFAAVIAGAPGVHLEYRIRRGDNQVRWIEISGCAVRDDSGALQRIVGISRDITEQKVLQEELVHASDQERQSIAHDLHDDACQRLAAIKMRSETLATLLNRDQSPHVHLAEELTKHISTTTVLLRNIARGLAAVEVEGDGLMLALQKLVQIQETIHEVPCFLDQEHTAMVTDGMVVTNLYRIAQEFITNAARHAKPQRIDVKLEELPDCVRLTVSNDGLPFQKPEAGHHMGLKIVHYRAAAVGASIIIRDRTDGIPGTVAECTVPSDICRSGPAGHKLAEPSPDSGAVQE